jgi:A/G-specific adenine glycosylase
VSTLAAANEEDVLAQWSGLGYYRRARMLHGAATIVQTEHAGRLPTSAHNLRKLPGIGRYTANAIASIASGEPVAVVDGNVARVIARLLGEEVSGENVWTTAQTLLDPEEPGDFNQAMMELGATVCVSGTPLCAVCPIKQSCAWRGTKHTAKSLAEQRTRRSASLLLARRAETVLLRRRSQRERLMPGMWELPPVPGRAAGKPLLRVKHSITTNDWTITLFAKNRVPVRPDSEWVSLEMAARLPLTGLTRKILRRLQMLA